MDKGKKKEKKLHRRFEDLQIDTLLVRPANKTKEGTQRFHGLSTFSDQLAHITVTDFDRMEDAEVIDGGDDAQFFLVVDDALEDVPEERETRVICRFWSGHRANSTDQG